MTVIRWENPPPTPFAPKGPRTLRPDPMADVAEELQRWPGRWGVVFEGANATAGGLAQTIRTARMQTWAPPGAFEACYRKDAEVTVVYARYIGGQS